jgi:hypothetical protein
VYSGYGGHVVSRCNMEEWSTNNVCL